MRGSQIPTAAVDEPASPAGSWVAASEPDPRFTLANERTFLAWIRTSLALLAGGVAVEAFMADLFGPELRKTVAVLLLVLALLIGGGSFFRWLNVERSMRRKAPASAAVDCPGPGNRRRPRRRHHDGFRRSSAPSDPCLHNHERQATATPDSSRNAQTWRGDALPCP